MGLRGKIGNWLLKAEGGGWDWLTAWAKGQESELGTTVNVGAAPDQVVWLYAAMDAIGVNASMPEIKVTINDREVDEGNEVKTLLERPAPDIMLEDALYITAAQLSVLGQSCWVKEPAEEMAQSINRLPEWIDFPDPRTLKRKPGNMGWEQTRPNGTKRSLPNEAVIMMRKPHPYRPWQGLSKLGPLSNTIQGMVEAERFNADFFKKGAVLSGILSTTGTLTTKQRQELQRSWAEKHQGRSNAHKVGITEGGVTYTPNQATQKDMDWVNLDRNSRDKILAAFRVPPVEISILDTANYNNAQEQRRMFWLEVILPMLSKIIKHLTWGLLVSHGRRERLQLNTQGIQALQKDFGPLVQTATGLWDRGVPWSAVAELLDLDLNLEALGQLADESFISGGMIPASDFFLGGLPDTEDEEEEEQADEEDAEEGEPQQGEEEEGQGGGSATGGSQASAGGERRSLGEQAAPILAAMQKEHDQATYEKHTTIWTKNLEGSSSLQRRMVPRYRRHILKMRKRMLKALDQYEAQLGKDAKAAMTKQLDACRRAARLGLSESTTMQKSMSDSLMQVIAEQYGLTEAELETWLRELWDEGIKLGVEQIAQDAEEGQGSTRIPDKANSILAEKELQLSERLGAPIEEVRKQLTKALDQLFAANSEATFVDVIEAAKEGIKTATNHSARRAQTIARTETGQVVQGAKQAWAEENGVTHMQWVSARIATTRDTHAAEDGNIAKINEKFPVTGLRHPKDSAGPAREIINCLCDQVPVPRAVAERYEARRRS